MPWYVAQMYHDQVFENVTVSFFHKNILYWDGQKGEECVWGGYIIKSHRCLCLKVPYFIAIVYNIVHNFPCLAINIINTHVIQLCAFFDMHKRVCVDVYLFVFSWVCVYYFKKGTSISKPSVLFFKGSLQSKMPVLMH